MNSKDSHLLAFTFLCNPSLSLNVGWSWWLVSDKKNAQKWWNVAREIWLFKKKKKMWHLSCSPCLTHSKPWSKQSQLPCAKQHYREAYKASIKENLRLVDSHMKRLEMYLLSPVKRHISKFGSKSSTVALKLFQFWLIPGLQSYPRSWPRDSQLS